MPNIKAQSSKVEYASYKLLPGNKLFELLGKKPNRNMKELDADVLDRTAALFFTTICSLQLKARSKMLAIYFIGQEVYMYVVCAEIRHYTC